MRRGKGVPLQQVRVRPPLPRPITIVCMAVNYMEDGTRAEPAPINAFHKSPLCVIGDGDTMVLPDVPATIFEGEAEVAVIIGKRASNVRAADAMGYVFGYTNFIDGSARRPAARRQYLLPDEVAGYLRAHGPLSGHRRRGAAIRTASQVQLWVNGDAHAELQHQRHGPQDPAVHRVGDLHPSAGARRRARHRDQPPWAQRLPEWGP